MSILSLESEFKFYINRIPRPLCSRFRPDVRDRQTSSDVVRRQTRNAIIT